MKYFGFAWEVKTPSVRHLAKLTELILYSIAGALPNNFFREM
jgi:hypothetical protein